jgi:hypothetical protein
MKKNEPQTKGSALEFIDPSTIGTFDATTLPKAFSSMIIGKRRTGKSVFLKDMMYKIRKWYKQVYIFSETLYMQPNLYSFVPKENRFYSFDQAKLNEIWDKQAAKIMAQLEVDPDADKTKMDHIMIIFDDCINDNHFRSSEILNRIHVSGRHLCISSIILSQVIGGRWGVNGVCRQNEDLVVCFILKSEDDRDLLVEQFLSTDTKKVGMKLFKDVVSGDQDEFQAIVIENYKNTRHYEKYVKKYVANPKLPKFEIGDKAPVVKLTPSAPILPTPLEITYRMVREDGSIIEL